MSAKAPTPCAGFATTGRTSANATPDPMSIAEARARLQAFLSWLPDQWD